LTYHTT